MPRQFKLKSQHYIDDKLLEAGEIVGEGTEVPFLHPDGTPRPPSTEMEGLNSESQKEVDAVVQKAEHGINPMEGLSSVMSPDAPTMVKGK